MSEPDQENAMPEGQDRFALYDLRVTVERVEGGPVCGLAAGDFFEVTESSRVRIPRGKTSALQSDRQAPCQL